MSVVADGVELDQAPSARRLAQLAPTTNELVDGGASLALIALALWAFESSFGGREFLVVGLLAAVIGLITAHLTDRFEVSVMGSVVIWVIVYLVVGGVLGARDQAIAGFIPSVDTLSTAITASIGGWKELLSTVPPVGQTGDLLVLPVMCGMFAAASSTMLARRRDWLVAPAVPSAIVLALGILCGVEEPVSVVINGGLFGVGVIGWAALRHGRRSPRLGSHQVRVRRGLVAMGIVAFSAILGLRVGDSLPFVDAEDRTVWRDTFEPPFDPSVFPSPLGYYRQFVKELEEFPMFEISGLPAGVPIRMATLDEYDGIVWKVSGGTRAVRGTAGYFERVGTDVDPEFERPEVEVTVSFPAQGRYSDVWLPTVGEVRTVDFSGENADRSRQLAEEYRYNRETDTGALLGRPRAGDSYSMTVALPALIDDLDDDAVVAASTFEPIEEVPGQVSGLGSGLVEDIDGIDRLVTLRDFLSGTGFYSDSREGQAAVPPGHGAGRLLQFADASELVGNAEQYAATLGLILRGSGIPARVVMGFVPREPDVEGTVVITGTDAEAWVEVLIEDVGWVVFFPTPDRNNTIVVEDDSPRPIPDRETQVPPPPPIIDADAETDPASDSEQAERERDEDEEDEKDDEVSSSTPWLLIAGLIAVGVPLLIFLIVIGTILLLKRRRRARRRRAGTVDARISNGWREVVDCAVDTGQEFPLGETRRTAARRLETAGAVALAERADVAVFGPNDFVDRAAVEYWADVDSAMSSIRGQLSFPARVKATISLESFRRARAVRRADRADARRTRQRILALSPPSLNERRGR